MGKFNVERRGPLRGGHPLVFHPQSSVLSTSRFSKSIKARKLLHSNMIVIAETLRVSQATPWRHQPHPNALQASPERHVRRKHQRVERNRNRNRHGESHPFSSASPNEEISTARAAPDQEENQTPSDLLRRPVRLRDNSGANEMQSVRVAG